MDTIRETIERVGEYAKGSGYACVVRAKFNANREPVLVLEVWGEVVEISGRDWPVVVDAANRALAFIGQHPDNS